MFEKLYFKKWSKDYTCFNFASDAWAELGKGALLDAKQPLEKPESPCVVYFSNGERVDSHVGIYINHRVLHLSLKGFQYIDFDTLKSAFQKVSFYK